MADVESKVVEVIRSLAEISLASKTLNMIDGLETCQSSIRSRKLTQATAGALTPTCTLKVNLHTPRSVSYSSMHKQHLLAYKYNSPTFAKRQWYVPSGKTPFRIRKEIATCIDLDDASIVNFSLCSAHVSSRLAQVPVSGPFHLFDALLLRVQSMLPVYRLPKYGA